MVQLYFTPTSIGWHDVRLGKKPSIRDPRTIQIARLFKANLLPYVPEREFNVDSQYPFKIPTPMLANDRYGDCVIAGRAHMSFRFEAFEQRKLITITEKNVTDEYFYESGGADNGLYLLESLKHWQKGWVVGDVASGKARGCWRKPTPKPTQQSLTIYAYGRIDPKNHDDVRATIYLLNGLYIGLALPKSAQSQGIWSVAGPVTDKNNKPWSWGGHCVYVYAYDTYGLWCVTWGGLKQMTWAFFETYCDEAYGIVDNRNVFTKDSPVDIVQLNKYLEEIRANGS